MADTDGWLTKSQIAELYGLSARTVERRVTNLGDDLIVRTVRPVLVSPMAVRDLFGEAYMAELTESNAELAESIELYRSEASAYKDDNERLRLARLQDQLDAALAERDAAIVERDQLAAALNVLTLPRVPPARS